MWSGRRGGQEWFQTTVGTRGAGSVGDGHREAPGQTEGSLVTGASGDCRGLFLSHTGVRAQVWGHCQRLGSLEGRASGGPGVRLETGL